jgi:hypothetical protein
MYCNPFHQENTKKETLARLVLGLFMFRDMLIYFNDFTKQLKSKPVGLSVTIRNPNHPCLPGTRLFEFPVPRYLGFAASLAMMIHGLLALKCCQRCQARRGVERWLPSFCRMASNGLKRWKNGVPKNHNSSQYTKIIQIIMGVSHQRMGIELWIIHAPCNPDVAPRI